MPSYPGSKPFFDMALGAAERTLLAVPPFSFPGVTARAFPLWASMDILASFCKRYLNVAPPEVCELHPYLPYVFLVILDYGQMAIETANLGWVSQHEVFFAVPLEMWHRQNNTMVFDGWVLCTPFIFVDNATSLTTGREVYGWPKVLASVRRSREGWLTDPRNPVQLLSLSVEGFGTRFDEKVPLLEIDHGLCQNPSLTPGDLTAFDPFHGLSRFTRGSWSALASGLELLLRSPLAGFGPQRGRLEEKADFLAGSLQQLSTFLQDPGVDVLTLKQFRDAEYPDDICYQALVKSRLGVDRVNHGGPLGLYNLLQGDMTGGFRIRLYDHPALPLATSLGLRTVRRETAGGRTSSLLEPLCPFWLSVDLTYGAGENLGWRMHGSPWYGKEGEIVGPASRAYRYSYNYTYNTVAGAAQQEWASPYTFPSSSCDVFPLKVHEPERMRRFINGYLNQGEPDHFVPWGDYVYMISSRSRIFSQARSAVVGEIAFFVPLLWYRRDKLHGVVLAKPYSFVDDSTFAMTIREVQGVPAIDATIETPRQAWLRAGPVLRMRTSVFRVLDASMGAEREALIEVMAPTSAWSSRLAGGPAATDREELCEIRKLTDKVFGYPWQVPVLTLKQFRDARDPGRACYQALILDPWKVFGKTPQPLGEGMEIHVYRYPSLPLAKTLGLVDPCKTPTQSPRQKRQAMVDVLTPECPFRAELEIEMGLADVLSHTAGNLPWVDRAIHQLKDPGRKGAPPPRRPSYPDVVELVKCLSKGPQWLVEKLLGCAPAAGSGAAPFQANAAPSRAPEQRP